MFEVLLEKYCNYVGGKILDVHAIAIKWYFKTERIVCS